MNDIRGMLLPLPTVFDDAGMIDEPVLRQMVDYYIGAGIHAMFVGGSMGQGMALTQDERKTLFDIVIGQVKKRIPWSLMSARRIPTRPSISAATP